MLKSEHGIRDGQEKAQEKPTENRAHIHQVEKEFLLSKSAQTPPPNPQNIMVHIKYWESRRKSNK